MRYAILKNARVVNVAVANHALAANWVQSNTAAIGDRYINGVFVKPEPETPHEPPPSDRITKLAFTDRLTPAEEIAIDLASIGATEQAATVRRFIRKIEMAEYVELTRADTISGVNTLEDIGLLSPGRANQILTAPIQEHERFRG